MTTKTKAFVDVILSLFIVFIAAALCQLSLPADGLADMLTTIVSMVVGSLFLAWRKHLTFPVLDAPLPSIVLAILIAFILNVPIFPVGVESLSSFYEYRIVGRIVFAILICLFIPICEEVYFRGFFLKTVSDHFGNSAGVFITLVVFILMHLGQEGIFVITISGIVYTWLAYRYKNILPAFLAHSTNNILWFISATWKA